MKSSISSNIILTRELLHHAATKGSGFNKLQFALLNVPFPPRKGWLNELIGLELSLETWERVEALRGPSAKKKAMNEMRRQREDEQKRRPVDDLPLFSFHS
jgi:hypothetical protein